MKLPNGKRAIVDLRKLQDYCLNFEHPRGRNKARVFASVGIRQSDAARLQVALIDAAANAETRPGTASSYGERYVIDFAFDVEVGTVLIRSSWIVRTGEDVPRLTTCYVL
jgi:hypothetical protein